MTYKIGCGHHRSVLTACITFALLGGFVKTNAQTLYVPSGTSGIGSTISAGVGVGTNNPLGQFETVSGNRRVSLNGTVQNATTGGLITMSRNSDAGQQFILGVTDGASYKDNVILGLGLSNEMRLVSGSTTSQGFGFYLNQIGSAAFGDTRPTPVAKIDGLGNFGLGIAAPTSRLHVVGGGNTTVDVKVTGRIATGDANNAGGVFLNSSQTMLIGQSPGTSNLVQIQNGSANRLTIDNLGNVGINTGTTTPTARLQVVGTGAAYVDVRVNGRIASGDAGNNGGVFVNSLNTLMFGQVDANTLGLWNNAGWMLVAKPTGFIGIGTTSPNARLDVVGQGNNFVDVRVNGRMQTGDANGNGGVYLNNSSSMLVGQSSATQMGLYNNGWRLVVNNAGNVGIGTTNTGSYKLAVEGKIGAREVNVNTTTPWPDYVFKDDYKLPSLQSVENYIDKNKHLPEVPTEKEVTENGLNLGEMNALLLKKIEELTLYVIQQQKEIDELKSKVK